MDHQAREDLAIIRRLMEDGSREVTERGTHFMIWGLVPAAGALATYAAATGVTGAPHPTLVWCVVLVAGWLASFVAGSRERRQVRVGTLARRLLSGIWVATGVTLTLLGLAGIFSRGLPASALPGILSIVMAGPMLVTMFMTKERWLGLVAAGWWIGGALMLWYPGVHTLLVMAMMSTLLLAVPGMVLRGKARRSAAGTGRAAIDVA